MERYILLLVFIVQFFKDDIIKWRSLIFAIKSVSRNLYAQLVPSRTERWRRRWIPALPFPPDPAPESAHILSGVMITERAARRKGQMGVRIMQLESGSTWGRRGHGIGRGAVGEATMMPSRKRR
jgi:hypothetical protein